MKIRLRFALAIFAFSPCSMGFAQTEASNNNAALRPVARNFGGWSTSTAQPITNAAISNENGRNVQHAFYQAQGSLSDSLPDFPTANFPAVGGFAPATAPDPAASNALPQLPNLPQSNMPGSRASAPVTPPSEVLPPNDFSSGGLDINPLPRDRAIPAQPASYTQPGGDLRQIRESTQTPANAGASGLRNPQSFATGLPYVTPAPRTGRYPTSPYMGPRYQVTAFQQQSIPAQTVAAQTGGLNAPAAMDAADQRPVLPQNQPTTGIYPTAYQQCAPQNFPAQGAVPGAYVPPTYTPNLAPGLYSSNNSGYSPLFSLGQENYNVLLGRGIVGQPTVYVPGQPFRNFFRYISP